MVLKIGIFGKQLKNTWKVLKCGGGEGDITWTDRMKN
jgi:hypothetical protein